MKHLTDSFGRKIDYLRLSVTDRCNLKCVYCTPAGGPRPAVARNHLSDGEVLTLVRCFAELGISKVRVTGGEPLMRPGIEGLLQDIASKAGIKNISLSTNGVLLAGSAHRLARAGLRSVNISLDTLKAERFRRIAGAGSLCQVLDGLKVALATGLHPVKLNVVVVRGMNDDEVPDFIRLTREIPVHVRFIELMPFGETGFFSLDRWVPISEIRQRSGLLEPVPDHQKPEGSGPAIYFRSPGALGTVGFIGALSDNFCHRCNRIRLTSTGKFLSCLAQQTEGTDLGAMVRSGSNPEEIKAVIRKVVRSKPKRHHMSAHESRIQAVHTVRGTWSPPIRRAVPETFMCSVGG